jgi:hypothetical protein
MDASFLLVDLCFRFSPVRRCLGADRVSRDAHSPDAAEQMIEVMGWRTNQRVRASWLVEKLTVPALLDALYRKDPEPLMKIKTAEDVEVFQRDEAQMIIDRLSAPATLFALERAQLHDLPRLVVSRTVQDGKGGTKHLVRDFTKPSLGKNSPYY